MPFRVLQDATMYRLARRTGRVSKHTVTLSALPRNSFLDGRHGVIVNVAAIGTAQPTYN